MGTLANMKLLLAISLLAATSWACQDSKSKFTCALLKRWYGCNNIIVKRACMATCGACGGGSCQDMNAHCGILRAYCSSNAAVRAVCKKTCGLCGGGSGGTPAPPQCKDAYARCDTLKAY